MLIWHLKKHAKTADNTRRCRIFTCLLLPFNDVRQLRVGDPRVQLALHQGRPLVVLDVSQVATLRHFDVFGEALGRKEGIKHRNGVEDG